MARRSFNVVSLSKVIFKFTSKQKRNLCYKLVTKVYDKDTGEIRDNDSLITEEVALELSKEFDIEIKDLDAISDETFEEFEEVENEESKEE